MDEARAARLAMSCQLPRLTGSWHQQDAVWGLVAVAHRTCCFQLHITRGKTYKHGTDKPAAVPQSLHLGIVAHEEVGGERCLAVCQQGGCSRAGLGAATGSFHGRWQEAGLVPGPQRAQCLCLLCTLRCSLSCCTMPFVAVTEALSLLSGLTDHETTS